VAGRVSHLVIITPHGSRASPRISGRWAWFLFQIHQALLIPHVPVATNPTSNESTIKQDPTTRADNCVPSRTPVERPLWPILAALAGSLAARRIEALEVNLLRCVNDQVIEKQVIHSSSS
jgi:hypothetical protein